jgi:hypothetical protein
MDSFLLSIRFQISLVSNHSVWRMAPVMRRRDVVLVVGL